MIFLCRYFSVEKMICLQRSKKTALNHVHLYEHAVLTKYCVHKVFKCVSTYRTYYRKRWNKLISKVLLSTWLDLKQTLIPQVLRTQWLFLQRIVAKHNDYRACPVSVEVLSHRLEGISPRSRRHNSGIINRQGVRTVRNKSKIKPNNVAEHYLHHSAQHQYDQLSQMINFVSHARVAFRYFFGMGYEIYSFSTLWWFCLDNGFFFHKNIDSRLLCIILLVCLIWIKKCNQNGLSRW